MRGYLSTPLVLLAGIMSLRAFGAQAKPAPALSEIQLELSYEVAATTREGYPAALRITVKNAGYVAVDLPMPGLGCDEINGAVKVQIEWRSIDPNNHSGIGWGCGGGTGELPSLLDRARNEWIRIQPGEFVTMTQNVRDRLRGLGPGFVDYWVEYEPPQLTMSELQQLRLAGYFPPTNKLKTATATFRIQ